MFKQYLDKYFHLRFPWSCSGISLGEILLLDAPDVKYIAKLLGRQGLSGEI